MAPDITKGHALEDGDLVASAAAAGATVPLPVSKQETENGMERVVLIDPEYVRAMVASIVKDQDLSRYIL